MNEKLTHYKMVATDEDQMRAVAQTLAKTLPNKGVIFLDADLGMGKTYLTREVIRAFGYSGTIKSPTYTLVEPYSGEQKEVLHFDLYRLSDPEELEFIGIWDYLALDALSFIEWPNKAKGVLPNPDLLIHIDDYQSGRVLTLCPKTAQMQGCLERMNEMLSKQSNLFQIEVI